ncbi:LysR family transcriptional regulator [Solemya velum gill symbiont]|uniref:LysR family transcriptional regulator n=1 Tax=Solemya velum gill symbiont TaxID=2340 RepID=UPI0009987BE5|nr:LysR family transcriptional regulator [Solemya velum gill symbiont]OOZ44382.1 LysR family transcriptional regulator [Solemya velum gill symbiont]OOZ46628.1 LysR family transcriptional regulator [Solemya velum gill symbiont]OOZ48952.1 LysR family transcriptional regulator [Solemya velum gill symbiont]OOZ51439.1 LysR family transcriptional regulator [Solemya velum gill symbiont]OOZ54014.1 LysR family transcriptional regulator [Solemya velum gill symbiont]
MDRFDNMDTFVRVVEAGTISGAAERMGIAKSAVSRRLKELEAHLNAQLFHRTTRKMNLTDTGRAYYHQCVRILDDVLEAEIATSDAHGTLKGKLKIALPTSFGLLHMGPAINDFARTHPDIEFDLDFNDREVDLIQEGFDLAIRIANLPDSSLIARRLTPIRTLLCASPEYLKQEGTPQSPQELSGHQCLVYTLVPDYDYLQLTGPDGKLVRIRVSPYMKASAGEYLKDAALAGLGIILVPSFIAHKEIEEGRLVPILSDYESKQFDAYAIYPQTRHLSKRVRTFVDFLVKRFEGIPAWDLYLNREGIQNV